MTSITGPNAERRAGAGFTLLELIAVLILISVLLALAAPSLGRFGRARATSDAASHLLALTHLARSQAAAQARIWRLNVDPEEAAYWLTMQQAGVFVSPRRDYGRVFRLPEGVSVMVTGNETDTGLTALATSGAAQAPCIQFYPDGHSDVATIELSDGQGRVLWVTAPSASERFRIETPSAEVAP